MTCDSAGAVLFDIDGTLVDSNYLHVFAWQRAFVRAGHPVDSWRIHRAIGMGSDQLLEALLGEQADAIGDTAKKAHSEEYAGLSDLLRPFSHANDLVRAVARAGAKVVLATSASPEELERLRATLGVEDSVAEITSSQDVERAKPEPDLVQVALQRAEVPADHAVFVGDTVWDVQAAGRAGVPCIGVLTGGVSEAELTEAGAVAVYEDAATLLRDLEQSPLTRAWQGLPRRS
ncbi:MAG: hypothetical protein QOH75_199 [Actinomycetota bacterium]|nr:hypothetical protein [Actinomycetota bacterium]